MKKLLIVVALVIAAAFALAEVVMPEILTGTLRQKVSERLATNDVQVTVAAAPRSLLSLGRADSLSIVAHDATVGAAPVREITLEGEEVDVDPRTYFAKKLVVRDAKELRVTAIIGEEELRRLITDKVDRLENVEVSINNREIRATANAKIFGRMADVELTGEVVDDVGGLFFRVTNLTMKNTLLGTARLEKLAEPIELLGRDKMPYGLEITEVSQGDGIVRIIAERKTNS